MAFNRIMEVYLLSSEYVMPSKLWLEMIWFARSSKEGCDTADFGAVGQTGAFELLRKKSAVKSL